MSYARIAVSKRTRSRVDSDGVTHITPARTGNGLGAWLVGGACVFALACIGLSVWWGSSDIEVEAPPPLAEVPLPVPPPTPEVRARAPRPRPPPVVAAAPQPVSEPGPELTTETDVQEGIQAAGQIGDDTLQKQGGGQVNPEQFTHGTSEQRQRWFRVGWESGDPKQCDTFKAGVNL